MRLGKEEKLAWLIGHRLLWINSLWCRQCGKNLPRNIPVRFTSDTKTKAHEVASFWKGRELTWIWFVRLLRKHPTVVPIKFGNLRCAEVTWSVLIKDRAHAPRPSVCSESKTAMASECRASLATETDILAGCTENLPPQDTRVIRVFVSSTFTGMLWCRSFEFC